MSDEVYQYAIGYKTILQVMESGAPKNLTGYTILKIIFKKPSGALMTKDGTIEVAANGTFSYTTTTTDDLDEAGNYCCEGYVEMGGGSKYYTSIPDFPVRAVLQKVV